MPDLAHLQCSQILPHQSLSPFVVPKPSHSKTTLINARKCFIDYKFKDNVDWIHLYWEKAIENDDLWFALSTAVSWSWVANYGPKLTHFALVRMLTSMVGSRVVIW